MVGNENSLEITFKQRPCLGGCVSDFRAGFLVPVFAFRILESDPRLAKEQVLGTQAMEATAQKVVWRTTQGTDAGQSGAVA